MRPADLSGSSPPFCYVPIEIIALAHGGVKGGMCGVSDHKVEYYSAVASVAVPESDSSVGSLVCVKCIHTGGTSTVVICYAPCVAVACSVIEMTRCLRSVGGEVQCHNAVATVSIGIL